jgi:metallophosphoesterase (TIGR00282 family)
VRVLFVGDIFGKPGRRVATAAIPLLRKREGIDLVIANGENSAGGNGLTAKVVRELYAAEIDCVTSGNHHWDKKEVLTLADDETDRLLRPLNYPPGTPGRGSAIFKSTSGEKCGVISLVGRLFMKAVDCPFRAAEEEVIKMSEEAVTIIVDFHAEATAEKQAFAHYMDGRVSAVLGTHTHVQTADERILPHGTAFISDVGMTGPFDSVIGVRKDQAIARFLTQLPSRFEVAKEDLKLEGVIVETSAGKASSIRRLQVKWEEVASASDHN